MDEITPTTSTKRLVLDLPPSCMQFCPIDSSYLAVGTYNLQSQDPAEEQNIETEPTECDSQSAQSTNTKPQSRNGSLILFRLDGDNLTTFQTEPQPSALLDLQFQPTSKESQSILAVISSTGTLTIYRLSTGTRPSLDHVATSRCDDLGEDVLFLQCNWHPSIENVIAVTTSTGLARILHLDEAWSIKSWMDLDIKNTLEAWSICFSNPDNSRGETGQPATTVYCGGDDSMLRYTSCLLSPEDNEQALGAMYSPIGIKGVHNAGVTAILPLSVWTMEGWRLVVTGSYDDQLRVFAIKDPQETYGAKMVQELAQIDLGGGVWRLKLIEMKSKSPQEGPVRILLLASCMHAGARVVEIVTEDRQGWQCSVLARFEEHQSMNYASDCIYDREQRSLRCVSTSFYDRLMCIWSCDV